MNHPVKDPAVLPWPSPQPLMLAPMQGLTNRGLRSYFTATADVLFTEFVRVRPKSRQPVAASDEKEIEAAAASPVPTVVQLIGRDPDALAAAARRARALGARHLNLNLGCPFGRMTGNSAGGALLRAPDEIPALLGALRAEATASLSVKLRAGYTDPEEIFGLLPVLEAAGVDFIVLHPRTVTMRYRGRADHGITARVAAATSLPVIANGDIFTAEDAHRVLARTGAAGLMLGRGAISDPLLFARCRGLADPAPTAHQRRHELRHYLTALATAYQEIFAGPHQVLCKLKAVVSQVREPALDRWLRRLRRSADLAGFRRCLLEDG